MKFSEAQAAAAPASLIPARSHCSDKGSRHSSKVRSAEVDVNRIICPLSAFVQVSTDLGARHVSCVSYVF